MAKGSAMRTVVVFGLGAGAVLWAGNAANPGSSHATTQAGVDAGADLINATGLLMQAGVQTATPLIGDVRNAVGATGLGQALASPADPSDPTAVPPKKTQPQP